jgi:hypothetical protein
MALVLAGRFCVVGRQVLSEYLSVSFGCSFVYPLFYLPGYF